MMVILATLGKEIQNVNEKIKKGASIQSIIQELKKETSRIRFNGNGYSQEWVKEAEKRKLFIYKNFTDNIENISKFGKVLIESGVYSSERELNCREKVAEDIYLKTVQTEARTVIILINKNIIPRIYTYLNELPKM
jgi:glutamine synthetase